MTIDTSEKLAGLLLPAFAMRRKEDLGIGDTQAVKESIDFCVSSNMAVLQLLPINETGGDNSPYNAISSVALDPVLLTMTPDMVPGLSQEMIDRVAPRSTQSELRELKATDYTRVKPLKSHLLGEAFGGFKNNHLSKNTPEAAEFKQFLKDEEHWLDDYTLFRTLIDANGGNASWDQWPEEQRSAQKAKKWLAGAPNKQDLQNGREFFAYVQWVAWRQWRDVRAYADARKVRLMGDIPFGVSRYSSDVWANQNLFDLDWSGGAPPETWFKDDPFTAKWGQNWGLPLYKWEAHKQEGFAWWRQRVQKCVEIFHYFRIDHVLGFFRIYAFPWVPERNGEFLPLTDEEAKKKTGGRLPGFKPRSDEEEEDAEKNAEEGKALLQVILDAAGSAGVVAEDLGMVPEYVRPLLTKLGIPGFTIPYWEHLENRELKPLKTLPKLSLITYATHDHQPLVTYYEQLVDQWHSPEGHAAWLDVQRLMRWLGEEEDAPPKTYTPELHHAFVKALLQSPCWLAVYMVTEMLATKERFNAPGTSGASNWSTRLDHPLDWYSKNSPFKERISDLAKMVKETKRVPQSWQATLKS
jgi:4-alpha-glucanotransferase